MLTQDDPLADRPPADAGLAKVPVTQARGTNVSPLTSTRVRALLLLILALALVLRLHDYTAAPRPSDNVDELAWAWAGISLLQDHSPTSWSYLPAYDSTFTIREPDNGRLLPGVHHWLDHPPLFALLIGGFAWLVGERQYEQISHFAIRLPVIALSLVTLLLCFLLGRRVLDTAPALLASALFAVAPGAVLGSRLVESEALLAPMLLLVLLLLHRILANEAGRGSVALLLLVCALAPLVKVPGACFGLIAAVILASRGSWRLAGQVVAASCLGLLAYAWYGVAVDSRQFLAVIQSQSIRHTSLLSGYEFIISAAGFSDSTQLHDGWWLLGWLVLAVVAASRRARGADLLLAWPLVGFAIIIMLVADPNIVNRYGWYRFAVYPLAYLLAADAVVTTVSRPTLVRGVLVLAVPGAAATLAWMAGGGPWNPPIFLDLAVLAVVLGACVWARVLGPGREGWRERWPQLAIGTGVAVLLLLNTAQSLRLAEVYRFL
jgi:4-amino-4-deoxy-L-arabinose transferase-like glycosyltransferase